MDTSLWCGDVRKIKKEALALCDSRLGAGKGWGLADYLAHKPLPATSHPTAPLPWEGIKMKLTVQTFTIV